MKITQRFVIGFLLASVGLLVGAAGLAAQEEQADWSHQVKLPGGEQAVELFNGKDLAGWSGIEKYWSVVDGQIRTANEEPVIVGTYLFTDQQYRDFRLLLEVKQTMGEKYSTMHSAVAALGERVSNQGGDFGFKGPLLMFCHDWGIWGADGRGRVYPPGRTGPMNDVPWEKDGDWNQIEILVIGDRIRMVANGELVIDYTEEAGRLKKGSIALQLHNNPEPQEFHFRGLVLVENPTDQLLTQE